MSRLATIYDPPRFQSARRKGDWFEGWYFKLVDAAAEHPLAVIPGVSHDESGGTSHSFVQLIRPGGAVRYIRFPYEAFRWSNDRFEIRVSENTFSSEGISLDLPATDDGPAVSGAVEFGDLSPWPVTLLAPGIMGWYRFVPRMECYHGVVSMDHTLSGTLDWGGKDLDFTGGRGYAEKDWGTGFPSSWLWAQSNHFVGPTDTRLDGVSLTLSIARIPWLGSSFTGHIAGLLEGGRLHRFTTYTGSSLTALEFAPGSAAVTIEDRRHILTVNVQGSTPGALKAPSRGAMTGRADEALDASVHVTLRTTGGVEVFEGTGRPAGVEIMNARGELEVTSSR